MKFLRKFHIEIDSELQICINLTRLKLYYCNIVICSIVILKTVLIQAAYAVLSPQEIKMFIYV